MQSAADRLARQAARNIWSQNQVSSLLRRYVSLHKEFDDGKTDKVELRRRAEVLVPAIDRLWAALKKEGGLVVPEVEKRLDAANVLAHQQDDFDSAQFGMALSQLEATFERVLKK